MNRSVVSVASLVAMDSVVTVLSLVKMVTIDPCSFQVVTVGGVLDQKGSQERLSARMLLVPLMRLKRTGKNSSTSICHHLTTCWEVITRLVRFSRSVHVLMLAPQRSNVATIFERFNNVEHFLVNGGALELHRV